MSEALQILALVVAVAVVAASARRLGLSAPLVLVVVGVVASFVPGVPDVHARPRGRADRPAARRCSTPRRCARRWSTSGHNRQAIGLAVGRRSSCSRRSPSGWSPGALLPGVPLAAALALGAVVAPPDAVAATAIARRVGLPRRIVTILEGESLLNDATALVRCATRDRAPIVVDRHGAGGRAATSLRRRRSAASRRRGRRRGARRVRRQRSQDPVLDTALSFVAPFLAYLAGRGGARAPACWPWWSPACCSGTSRRRCSRRPRGSPSRPTGARSSSCWRTRSSC